MSWGDMYDKDTYKSGELALTNDNDVRHWCLKNYEKIIGVSE